MALDYIVKIENAIAQLNSVLSSCNTNVFVRRTNEPDYIEIISGEGNQAG